MSTPLPSGRSSDRSGYRVASILSYAFAILLGALATWASLSGCVREPDGSMKLAAPAEQGIVAGELILCDTVVGALDAPLLPACPGQSALLKAALDKVTALVNAPPAAGPSMPSVATSTHPLIRTSRGYAVWWRNVPLGYVPTAAQARAIHTPQIQLYLDGLAPGSAPGSVLPARDAGAEGGGR